MRIGGMGGLITSLSAPCRKSAFSEDEAVDYDRAQKIFAPEVVGFGTYASVVRGVENLRADQWSNIWPTIREFTFRLDELHWGAEGNLAWAACPWDSVGFRAAGTPFPPPARATLIFQ